MSRVHRFVAVELVPPVVARVRRIEGLRVQFSVHRDLDKSANTCEIKVYNLAQDTRDFAEFSAMDVRLLAGYLDDDSVEELFLGELMDVSHAHQSPEWVTTLPGNDGQRALREQIVSRSYAPGTSATKIVGDLLKDLGLPKKFVASLKDKSYPQGVAFNGRVKDALDSVVKRLGGEWSVQNGLVQVLEAGKGVSGPRDGLLLTEDSGMLGSPERVRKATTQATAKDKKPGWKVRCLLEPRITPGGWVGLRCQAIPRATAFKVESVDHVGDTHGQEWFTDIELADPGVPI